MEFHVPKPEHHTCGSFILGLLRYFLRPALQLALQIQVLMLDRRSRRSCRGLPTARRPEASVDVSCFRLFVTEKSGESCRPYDHDALLQAYMSKPGTGGTRRRRGLLDRQIPTACAAAILEICGPRRSFPNAQTKS